MTHLEPSPWIRPRRALLGCVGLSSFTLAGCHLLLGLSGADERESGPDGGAVSQVSATCAAYCERITDGCTGAERQYQGEEHCQVFCAQLEARGGRPFSCRVSALEDSAAACSTAGPLGVGPQVCEDSPCELYCDLMSTACGDTSLEPGQAGPAGLDRSECIDRCRVLPVSEFAVPEGSLLMGSDLNCRIQHINVALTFAEGTPSRRDHCLHGAGRPGLAGNRPCGPDATAADHSAAHE